MPSHKEIVQKIKDLRRSKLTLQHPQKLLSGLDHYAIHFFELSVCKENGPLFGNYLVPLEDELRSLIGFAVFDPCEKNANIAEEKFLYWPNNLDLRDVLFNYGNIRGKDESITGSQEVVLTDGFFSAMRIFQAGFPNVTGLLKRTTSLSDKQKRLLLKKFDRFVLFFGSENHFLAQHCLKSLVSKSYVRVIELGGGREVSDLSDYELRTLIPPQES